MNTLIDILFLRTWWRFEDEAGSAYALPYRWLNITEGVIWLIIAGLIVHRYLRRGHSRVELVYAASFVTFALTDFREAVALESWLIWVKALNLVAIVLLRRHVMQRWYPQAKVF